LVKRSKVKVTENEKVKSVVFVRKNYKVDRFVNVKRRSKSKMILGHRTDGLQP